MIPSLTELSLDKFITTFVPNKNSKEYFKKNLGSDFHHLICQKILKDHCHLLSQLAYFTDPDTRQVPSVHRLCKSDSKSPIEVANLFLATFPNLKKLNLKLTKIQFDQLNPPENSPLEELDLACSTISEENLKVIKDKFPHLKKINFYATNITTLKELPSTIEELDLTNCSNLPLEAFTAAKNLFPRLKKVVLTNTQNHCVSTRLTGLPELPSQVEEIDFICCKAIPAQEFETIKEKYPNLKKINLMGTSIESLTGLPFQLEELILSYILLTAKIEILKDQCPHLKKLDLCNNFNLLNLEGLPASLEELSLFQCTAIPEQEFVTIKNRCPNLKEIHLDHTHIKSLKGLEGLPLERLSLGTCKEIPAQEFETLKDSCPHLKIIKLCDTQLSSLKGLPSQIEELSLGNCQAIPAEEFENLKNQCPNLKKIGLDMTQIKSLAGLPATLEEIYLRDCKGIPAAEFLTIKEKFPHLRTIYLSNTQINSLEGLKGLPHLDYVILRKPGFATDVSLFKKMYPHVYIE